MIKPISLLLKGIESVPKWGTLDFMEYSSDANAQAAYVSNDAANLQSYSESTIKTQGSYSLKAIASTSSLNKTLTRTIAPVIEQLTTNDDDFIGDVGDVEYRPRQSFLLSSSATIDKVIIYISSITGSPSGQVTLRIETDNGGSPGQATGTLAHANATITFDPAVGENTLDFTNFTLSAGIYWIVINCDNQATNVKWRIYLNTVGGYSGGRFCHLRDGEWIEVISGAADLKFQVITVPIDLSGQTKWKFDMRASRTGSNVKVGIHDAGGTTTETTPNITSADTIQTVEVDISGVADADKNAIDKIIITPTNADSSNTIYLDYLRYR